MLEITYNSLDDIKFKYLPNSARILYQKDKDGNYRTRHDNYDKLSKNEINILKSNGSNINVNFLDDNIVNILKKNIDIKLVENVYELNNKIYVYDDNQGDINFIQEYNKIDKNIYIEMQNYIKNNLKIDNGIIKFMKSLDIIKYKNFENNMSIVYNITFDAIYIYACLNNYHIQQYLDNLCIIKEI